MASTKETLLIELAQKGVTGPAVEPTIDKIVAAIPTSLRGNYPEDREEAALAFLGTYYTSYASNPAPVSPTETQTAPVPEAQPSAMTAEQKQKIYNLVNQNRAQTDIVSQKTIIKKILLEKPLLKEYVPEGTTVVPVCKDNDLAKYEAKLIDTPENRAAFEEIKAAVKNGTPMPVYRDATTYKTAGYLLVTPKASNSAEMEELLLTTNGLIGFLATKASGYIATNGEAGLGAKLKFVKTQSKKNKASVQTVEGSPRAYVTNRKAALEGKEFDTWEIISKVDETQDKVKGRLRIAKTFQINNGVNEKDEPLVRTVRLSGAADLPVFIRANAQYEEAFPMSTKQSGFTKLIGRELEDALKAKQEAVAFIYGKGNKGLSYGIDDTLEKLGNINTAESVADVNL